MLSSPHNAAGAYDGGPADSLCLDADFFQPQKWSVGPLQPVVQTFMVPKKSKMTDNTLIFDLVPPAG